MPAYQFEKTACPSTISTCEVFWDSQRRVTKEDLPTKLITLTHSESLSFVQSATGTSI